MYPKQAVALLFSSHIDASDNKDTGVYFELILHQFVYKMVADQVHLFVAENKTYFTLVS